MEKSISFVPNDESNKNIMNIMRNLSRIFVESTHQMKNVET